MAYEDNYNLIDWSDKPWERRERRQSAPPNRSHLASPRLVRPFSEPIQSMANGQWCDTSAELSATHKAANNPAGVDYIELGNERVEWKPAEFNEKERRDDIRKSLHDVMNGNVPPEIQNIQ